MYVHVRDIPTAIFTEYNLAQYVHNDRLLVEIRKGMYGLPQAGRLANELLQKRLALHGYAPVVHTPGLWTHQSKAVSFVLVVDDFAVKYSSNGVIFDVTEWFSP